jgi:hypothetical protein
MSRGHGERMGDRERQPRLAAPAGKWGRVAKDQGRQRRPNWQNAVLADLGMGFPDAPPARSNDKPPSGLGDARPLPPPTTCTAQVRGSSKPLRSFEERVLQRRASAQTAGCPRQESNLRTRFRKPLLYPLSYGGFLAQPRRFTRDRALFTVALTGATRPRAQGSRDCLTSSGISRWTAPEHELRDACCFSLRRGI